MCYVGTNFGHTGHTLSFTKLKYVIQMTAVAVVFTVIMIDFLLACTLLHSTTPHSAIMENGVQLVNVELRIQWGKIRFTNNVHRSLHFSLSQLLCIRSENENSSCEVHWRYFTKMILPIITTQLSFAYAYHSVSK